MLKIEKFLLQLSYNNIKPVWMAHWLRACQWVQGSRVQTRLTPANFKVLIFLKLPPKI